MINLLVTTALRNRDPIVLREGAIRPGEALEALAGLVRTSPLAVTRSKFIQLSRHTIVVESGRYLNDLTLPKKNTLPSGCGWIAYSFTRDSGNWGGDAEFDLINMTAWAYALAYPRTRSSEVSAYVADPDNNPLPSLL